MFYIKILLLLFCPVIADTFSTAFGECTLEIYGGRVDGIPEFVQIIKDESKKINAAL